MVYCLSALSLSAMSSRPKGALSLRIIGSIYINYFETPTNPNYVGHNPKKRYPYPAISLKINSLGLTMT
jgi:hypothetical protein